MDDKANYSTLVFKNSTAAQKEEKDNQTIYSEVKPKKQATTAPKEEIELTTHPVEKPEKSAAADQNAKTAAKHPTSRLLMCLGTLCVLLLSGVIILLATLMMLMKQQEALEANNKTLTEENTNLTIYNRQLHVENGGLMNRTQELIKERDGLNWTLQVILTFDTFPVKDFCPNKNCQPCQNSWLLFQNKCYLFQTDQTWNTWQDSRTFCQSKSADLVVVENLQEQEFVSNHSEPYYDNFHGYWLGLRQMNNTWVWVDGHEDTLGYWVTAEMSTTRPYVLLLPTGLCTEPNLPKRALTQTWAKGDSLFKLRFICERKALIKFN